MRVTREGRAKTSLGRNREKDDTPHFGGMFILKTVVHFTVGKFWIKGVLYNSDYSPSFVPHYQK